MIALLRHLDDTFLKLSATGRQYCASLVTPDAHADVYFWKHAVNMASSYQLDLTRASPLKRSLAQTRFSVATSCQLPVSVRKVHHQGSSLAGYLALEFVSDSCRASRPNPSGEARVIRAMTSQAIADKPSSATTAGKVITCKGAYMISTFIKAAELS